MKFVTSGIRHIFKKIKRHTSGNRYSAELSRILEKVWGLNKPQVRSYEKYVKKTLEGVYETEILHLPNGGKGFATIVPPSSKYPNSGIIWEKYLDAEGKTILMGKRTFDAKTGRYAHFHQKWPIPKVGDTYPYTEQEYWQILRSFFKDFQPRKGKL
jgi:hypothetical protein